MKRARDVGVSVRGPSVQLRGSSPLPSTLGTFLRSFRWGHVRQLDRVSRELLAMAWKAGAGPGAVLIFRRRIPGGAG